jgi:hypothetical protein
MDADLERTVPQERQDRVETPDGQSVFVFRYDNPEILNRNPNSPVSQDELVGKWFTDSLSALETYIFMRPSGGNIIVARIPKEKLDTLKAADHPVAKNMDIEPLDNYIIPQDLLTQTQVIPVDVVPGGKGKYIFKDKPKIDEFVRSTILELQAPAG